MINGNLKKNVFELLTQYSDSDSDSDSDTEFSDLSLRL